MSTNCSSPERTCHLRRFLEKHESRCRARMQNKMRESPRIARDTRAHMRCKGWARDQSIWETKGQLSASSRVSLATRGLLRMPCTSSRASCCVMTLPIYALARVGSREACSARTLDVWPSEQTCRVQVALPKFLCANCTAQVALCKLLQASCCLQVVLRKLLCASCSVQVAVAKLLCASALSLRELLCASCSAQVALRKLAQVLCMEEPCAMLSGRSDVPSF